MLSVLQTDRIKKNKKRNYKYLYTYLIAILSSLQTKSQ